MDARLPGLCATLAFAAAFVACRDTSTEPRHETAVRTPRFSATSDTGGGGGGGNQFHFVANGVFGDVNWFDADSSGGGGFTFGSLNVGRGGTTKNPQTFLSYFVQQCDEFFDCSFFGGFGLIPNRDLSGGGKTLHLSTNTTGNPNFFTFGGPTGLVVVDWKVNGFFQFRSSGTSQQESPGFKFISNGIFSFASANAAGSVVGLLISPNNSGGIGSNHSVVIDIFH